MVGKSADDNDDDDVGEDELHLSPPSSPRTPREEIAASSTLAILLLWTIFVANRAVHPLLIDLSKVGTAFPYKRLSPVIGKCILTVALCNLMACFDKGGWKAGVKKCIAPDSLQVFGTLGCIYAVGDFLEMMSMSSMDGATYQVLLQSQLMVTAVLMWAIKGRMASQSPAQWCALIAATLGMSLFIMVQHSGSGSGEDRLTMKRLVGTFFVLGKVFISCFCTVKADASLKRFNHLPLYAQLSQLMGPWALSSAALACIFDSSTVSSASSFFEGWSVYTVLVMCSGMVRTIITMSLLKILDSVLKNIGEAIAMLVIYMVQVMVPVFAKDFEIDSFLSMLVVVMTVTVYLLLRREAVKTRALKEKHVKLMAEVRQVSNSSNMSAFSRRWNDAHASHRSRSEPVLVELSM
eukprot:TRINITY_DN43960_c0_g1_i1.p1 TRINITY_DN43960_c0_g1~~TRINITY_DN43960_c0_g1_i1.p1  ORF type:complete len:407 (-),score=50.83 TRINITY_DN43960_c0_g1_i1:102-1322(-)